MADFLVRIDDKIWADFLRTSAFEADEEAVRHILTMAFYQGDPDGISTKLIHATGKIRVLKIPSPAASDRIRAILNDPPKELGSGSFKLPPPAT